MINSNDQWSLSNTQRNALSSRYHHCWRGNENTESKW